MITRKLICVLNTSLIENKRNFSLSAEIVRGLRFIPTLFRRPRESFSLEIIVQLHSTNRLHRTIRLDCRRNHTRHRRIITHRRLISTLWIGIDTRSLSHRSRIYITGLRNGINITKGKLRIISSLFKTTTLCIRRVILIFHIPESNVVIALHLIVRKVICLNTFIVLKGPVTIFSANTLILLAISTVKTIL